jgi:hypothetical protein
LIKATLSGTDDAKKPNPICMWPILRPEPPGRQWPECQ